MRSALFTAIALVASSSFVLVACGDDSESGTSSGGGATTSSSADTTTATGSTAVTGSGGSDGEGGAGGASGSGGEATGGAGGSAEVEVVEGPGFRSGSRLRPVYLDGGEGARQLLHWYDTELELPCRFMETTAAGDAYTCLPLGQGGARIAFIDPACTEPVMVIADDACGARFASSSVDYEIVQANTTTSFGRGTRTTFERGDVLAPQPPIYERGYEGFDPSCTPASLDDGEVVHAASAPVIPLVTATRELESLGDGLARAVAHGDDGSMQLMGPFEEDSATACQVLLNAVNEAGGVACAPAVIAEFASPTMHFGNIHYSDDACSLPAASVVVGALPAALPDYVVGPSEEVGELVAYERGPQLDVAYSGFSGSCHEHVGGADHYALGAPLDRTFPHIFHVTVPGDRLASATQGSASGEIAGSAYAFADTTYLGVPCSAAVFASENDDGSAPLRCVPYGFAIHAIHEIPEHDDYFADAECTDPLVEGTRGGAEIDAHEVGGEPACMAQVAGLEVTRAALFEPYEGSVYYRSVQGCRLRETNGGPPIGRYVRELEPEEFAILTLVDPATDAPL